MRLMDALQKLKLLGCQMALEPAEETGSLGASDTPRPSHQIREADLPVHDAIMPGGKRIALLKTLLTSACERDCLYCPFRAGRDFRRATFQPDELARVFLQMHSAGKVEGLFLSSGVAGGGDIILIPEIPFDLAAIVAKVKERNRRGRRFSIVVIAEGAKPKGGDEVVRRLVEKSSDPVRLGGIGFVVQEQLERATGIESRTVVLGHLQRGGSPTATDRVLATQLGSKAVDLIVAQEMGLMVAVKGCDIIAVPLEVAAGGPRTVPLDLALIASARSIGTSFGD